MPDPSPIFRAGGATASRARRNRLSICAAARAAKKLAGRFLRQNGYKILYRNFRGGTGGEIDIVCRDHDTLVFVEVKTRADETFGRPFEAIGADQRNRIARGGLAWLRLLDNPEILFRFDVVEVVITENGKPRFELIKNAFQLPQSYIY